jgi:nitrate reductase beta subunit
MYKREEDGIVLVDQNACRAWRMCVSSCPYKKVYFNWQTNKAEKCTLCFPRIEAGLPTICSETCVGRIRYLGVMFYDADKVQEAASVAKEQDLYEAQLGVFLDPNDPEVIKEARKAGIAEDWIEAAQRSPIYRMVMDWRIALPLHPEYRTLPMVWYVPPLSPITNCIEGQGSSLDPNDIFPAIDNMRIPIEYLANLLTAGDTEIVRGALRAMATMRIHMRNVQTGRESDPAMLKMVGHSKQSMEDMYRLLAIAKYNDRFVIPPAHREKVADLFNEQGGCGLDFAGGPGACGVFEQGGH